jgi:hypothetical protein
LVLQRDRLDVLRPPFLELVEMTATEVARILYSILLAPLKEHPEPMLVVVVGALGDFGSFVGQILVGGFVG